MFPWIHWDTLLAKPVFVYSFAKWAPLTVCRLSFSSSCLQCTHLPSITTGLLLIMKKSCCFFTSSEVIRTPEVSSKSELKWKLDWIWKNMCIISVFVWAMTLTMTQKWLVLKYLTCLYELCITPTAADRVSEQATSGGQTTITNFPLFLQHRRAPVPFTSRTIFASFLSLHTPPSAGSLFENLCPGMIQTVFCNIKPVTCL